MLKVLIADDEQLICQMIRKMIDWEAKGLTVAGFAENGLEVLEKTAQLRPDIVITDIRMPGLDGLAMIRQVLADAEKSGAPAPEFVIISGYKNFEYAHQALTLGVRHYLLKPIDQQELSDTLDRIAAGKRKTEAEEADAKAQEQQHEAQRRNARQHFLNSILKDSRIRPEETGLTEEEILEFRNSSYLAFFVKVDWTEEGAIAPGLLEILKAVVEREETEWGCEFVSSPVQSGLISVINYPDGAKEAHPEDMVQLFTKCRKETDKFAGYTVTFGVGSEKDSIARARESIDEAVCAVKCRVRKGIDRVIFFEDLRYREIPPEELFTQDEKAGNRRAIGALDYDAVRSDFDELTNRLMEDVRHSPISAYALIEAFAALIVEVLGENGVEKSLLDEFSVQTELVMDRSTQEARMLQSFREAIGTCFRKVIAQRRQSGQAPIREAKAWLAQNFAGNPSLEEAAEAVGMSPAYLSTLFKKEVGIGFSDYLIQLRCEEAKRLMRETDEPMTVISERVGYQDAKYFSRIFRKTVGIKPSEYRKLYR